MKIDNSFKTTVLPPNNRAKARSDADSQAASATSDDVKFSALAGQFQAGEANPPFDSGRVQEIKQAIAEGRFAINAGSIADRLIDSARDLVLSQRKA